METNIIPDMELKNELSTKPLNLWQRITGMLWGGSRKTFEDIIATPKLTGIIVLVLGISLILAILVVPKIKELNLWAFQSMPNAASMPASAMSAAVTAAVVAALAVSMVAPMIMWLITAALLKLFNSFSGEKTPFKILFNISVYSYLPIMIASIIKTGLIMSSPAQNMTRVSTSLALFLPGDKIDRVYMIISQIDPFFIWSMILLALGSSLAMKVAFKKTAIFIGVLWVMYSLAAAFLTSLSKVAS